MRIRRYREILSTLAKYGFGEVVSQMGLGPTLQFGRRIFTRRRKRDQDPQLWQRTTWEWIRMALEELGPTFIKLGQILGNRPDLIPQPMRRELEKLQDAVPSFPGAEAIRMVALELGGDVGTLFKEFDESPVAAASIAQVHRAVLSDGTEVAVKVQRPEVRDIMDVDIQILHRLAQVLEKYFEDVRALRPTDIVEEFRKAVSRELDFMREAASMERLARQFSEDETIVVPRVHWSHCTRTVLTMQFIRATRLAEVIKTPGFGGHSGPVIARRGAELVLRQIFDNGFFHGDPHPGNIFVLSDDRICFLDYGLMGSLTRNDTETFGDILISIMRRNEQKARRALVAMCGGEEPEEPRRMEREISELIDQFHDTRASDFSFGALLSNLVDTLVDHGLSLPPDLFLLVKALMTVEGVATALDPDFRFVESVQPFAEKLVRDRYDPSRIATRFMNAAAEFGELLQGFPADYRDMVRTIRRGRIQFTLEEGSLVPLRRTVSRVTASLVFALVLGSLIIGSSVIVHSRVPPLWYGIPVIGILGFVAAGMVGFWLLVTIIRNRMM
jgi:ubiquinone biosynthesis protein